MLFVQQTLLCTVYLHKMYDTAEQVQVQYPDALQTMLTDLGSIRNWAGYLQKTEIKFDMLSAVDELAKQVKSAPACSLKCATCTSCPGQHCLPA